MFRKSTIYIGPNGEKIQELTACNQEDGSFVSRLDWYDSGSTEPYAVYEAIVPTLNPVVSPMRSANGSMEMNVVPLPIEVYLPIEATTLKEAFANFGATINAVQKQVEENQKQKQPDIYVPNKAESQAINNLKLVRP